MRIVIAGGSGFLGTPLSRTLAEAGHAVVVLTRHPDEPRDPGMVRYRLWTPDGETRTWGAELDGADVVINLAGAGIADGRWSSARRRLILESRVNATRSLAIAIRAVKSKPSVFIQASAVGFYGAYDNGGEFDETSSPGTDFLADVCVAWEAEAHPLDTVCRVVFIRTGFVLGTTGGGLPKLLRPYRFFVGGPVGSGHQTMSWIHVDDWVGLVVWAIGSGAVSGPINATAPHPVTNTELSRAIGRALHRPSWIPVPAAVLKLMFGEMAKVMLLRGQRVLPRRALELGYHFRHEEVDGALSRLFAR